jgi:hypothetical protein
MKEFKSMNEAEILALCASVAISKRAQGSFIKRWWLGPIFPNWLASTYVFNDASYFITLKGCDLHMFKGSTAYVGGDDFSKVLDQHNRKISRPAAAKIKALLL